MDLEKQEMEQEMEQQHHNIEGPLGTLMVIFCCWVGDFGVEFALLVLVLFWRGKLADFIYGDLVALVVLGVWVGVEKGEGWGEKMILIFIMAGLAVGTFLTSNN